LISLRPGQEGRSTNQKKDQSKTRIVPASTIAGRETGTRNRLTTRNS